MAKLLVGVDNFCFFPLFLSVPAVIPDIFNRESSTFIFFATGPGRDDTQVVPYKEACRIGLFPLSHIKPAIARGLGCAERLNA